MSRIPDDVIEAVCLRADGCCEACAEPITGAVAFHHRKLRSQGGLDEVCNLMVVHGGITGGCHNLHQNSIHQNPARSYRLGHIVKREYDPASIAVLTFDDDHPDLPADGTRRWFGQPTPADDRWVENVWGGLR